MLFRRIPLGTSRLMAAVAVSTALSACFMPAFAEDQAMTVIAHASSGPLQCEIRKTEQGGAVQLSGVVTSSRMTAGHFRFTVTKSGPSGASNIHQADKFDLVAGQETHIGTVNVNLDRGGQVVVELSVASDDGLQCQATASLKT